MHNTDTDTHTRCSRSREVDVNERRSRAQWRLWLFSNDYVWVVNIAHQKHVSGCKSEAAAIVECVHTMLVTLTDAQMCERMYTCVCVCLKTTNSRKRHNRSVAHIAYLHTLAGRPHRLHCKCYDAMRRR